MPLQQITPHIVTAASLFLAIFIHWKVRQQIFKPSLVAGAITALIAEIVVFVLQHNYLNLDLINTSPGDWVRAVTAVAGFGFLYGFIIAMLVGYIIKVAPSFFD